MKTIASTFLPFADERIKGYRLENDGGMTVELIDHGATVTRIEVPDRAGIRADVVLGCPDLAGYLGDHPHLGCLVGRYANRITRARFELDGATYDLDPNIPPHHLHGGRNGFHRRSWQSERVQAESYAGVTFRLTSRDGDCGYPGTLEVEAQYRLYEANRLVLEVTAVSDKATPVSVTSHHYFNLGGVPGSSVLDHELSIAADFYCPVTPELTQRGVIEPCAGSAFDLNEAAVLGDRLKQGDPQLKLAGGGFDHHFVVRGEGLRHCAEVRHPPTGRTLTVASDQPGLQLYTGNGLDAIGKGHVRYARHGGFCLETQQFPDAPNQPAYPNAILRPGETFRAVTEFAFGVV